MLAAAPGSQHGYDVVDHARVDPELGGEAGLQDAATRLREHGIGIVLDVVPNHMAMTVPEYLNRVVWSVLRDGPASPHAGWLDVDWAADRPVLLPFLGRRIDECLDAGEIVLDPTGGPDGEPVVRYFEHVLPVRPGTEHLPLEDLLAAQAYRLAFWRVADEELNYRRFFDIDTLVGLRVEDPAVFAATHAVVLRLLGEGLASGLRIDHPDGLADPRGYLRRLAAAAPPGAWVVVEKILEGDEELPADWPCAGTTGYDALAAVGAAFVDPAGAPVLTSAFAELAGADETWPEAADAGPPRRAARSARRRGGPAGAGRARGVPARAAAARPLAARAHRGGVRAARGHAGLPRVRRPRRDRAAGCGRGPRSGLRAGGRAAAPSARRETALLRDLALGRLGRGVRKDEFCVRFQQTTGPAMAKGVEDTAAYRWFPLTCLAEVGSRPDGFGAGAEALHRYARRRLAAWPDALTASSTHDSKRSEDTRARLSAISEIPGEWVGAVRGWRALAGELGRRAARSGCCGRRSSGPGRSTRARLTTYLVKAAREAKLRTSWTRPDRAFEDGRRRVRAAGPGGRDGGRQRGSDGASGCTRRSSRTAWASARSSCCCRASPTCTPGCESVSLRLVDPDNRRPPDLADLAAVLARGLAVGAGPVGGPAGREGPAHGARAAAAPRPPRAGSAPTAATNPWSPPGRPSSHLLGFVRAGRVAVLATRLALGLAARGGWRGTTRRDCRRGSWTDLLTGRVHHATGGDPAAGVPVDGAAGLAGRAARPRGGLTCGSRCGRRTHGPRCGCCPRAARSRPAPSRCRSPPRRAGRAGTPGRSTGCGTASTTSCRSTAATPSRTRGRAGCRRACTARPGCGTPPRTTGTTPGGPAGRWPTARWSTSCTSGPSPAPGTLDAAAEHLRHLVDLGVTHVELMPLAAFDGPHGWGYDSVALEAVHEPYGGPAALCRFVDAAHRHGLAVLVDVVQNHLGPSGNHWEVFGPFLTDEHSTPWGAAVNLDAAWSDDVRSILVASSLDWLTDFHLDGLRLDAVHALRDDRAITYPEELAAAVDVLAERLGRPLALVAETDRNDPATVLPRRDGGGGLGLTAQWDDDVHHALHWLLTDEAQEYYADFASPASVAHALERAYLHDGRWSSFRRRTHGRAVDWSRTEPWRFVVSAQTHDQVGNRAAGERIAVLAGRDRAGVRRRPAAHAAVHARCCSWVRSGARPDPGSTSPRSATRRSAPWSPPAGAGSSPGTRGRRTASPTRRTRRRSSARGSTPPPEPPPTRRWSAGTGTCWRCGAASRAWARRSAGRRRPRAGCTARGRTPRTADRSGSWSSGTGGAPSSTSPATRSRSRSGPR